MASMEALLKIRADVQGEGKVSALGKALGGLNSTAAKVSGGLKGMLSGFGGLTGALGSLAGVAAGGGLVAIAKGAIDAADNMRDLSQRTGVSVERLSQFKTAAEMSGTSIEKVGGALVKLSKTMSQSLEDSVGAAAGAIGRGTAQVKMGIDQQVQLIQQQQQQQVDAVKAGAERQVQEVRTRERRQLDAIDAGQERSIATVKAGEQRQLDAIERAADQRQQAVEKESDARLREINRRYRQEEKLLSDAYDDQRDRAQEQADDEQRVIERRIERSFDLRRKEIQQNKTLSDEARDQALQDLSDQQEAELEVVRDRFKEQAKIRDRGFRDEQEQAQQAIEDRKRQEEEAEQSSTDAKKRAIQERAKVQKAGVEAATAAETAAIRKGAEEQKRIIQEGAKEAEKAIRAAAAVRVKALTDESKAAADAFKKLGIELKNFDGTIRSTGDVMLDVADRFKAMPDGVNKTRLALDLFGKSGYEMIPLLNMGGEAVKALGVTMTTDFANSADEFNDKFPQINASMTKLSGAIAMSLLPALNLLADGAMAVAGALANLPGPVQAIVGVVAILAAAFIVLAPAIAAVVSIAGVLAGLKIGATIAGWAAVALPAITAIGSVLGNLAALAAVAGTGIVLGLQVALAWITGTFIPALLAFFSGPVGWTVLAVAAVVAMAIAFREPILQFLAWLGENFKTGMAAVNQGLYAWFVQPWVDLWNNVLRGPILTLMTWIGETFTWAAQAWYAVLWQLFVQPFVNVWDNVLRVPVTGFVQWLAGAWGSVAKGFNDYVVQPISMAWIALIQLLPKAMASAVKLVQGAWTSMISAVQNAMRGVLQFIANGLNNVGGLVNRLIGAFNQLPGSFKIPYVPTFNVQPFAAGGFVNRPTMGLVGEAGPEYIIPAAKMQGASERFLAGARGSKVFSTGPIGGRGMRSSNQQSLRQAQFSRAPRPPAINVTTGPVLQFNNQLYVTQQDMLRALRTSQNDMLNRLRTPAARIALGRA